jgi:hypothetical protein
VRMRRSAARGVSSGSGETVDALTRHHDDRLAPLRAHITTRYEESETKRQMQEHIAYDLRSNTAVHRVARTSRATKTPFTCPEKLHRSLVFVVHVCSHLSRHIHPSHHDPVVLCVFPLRSPSSENGDSSRRHSRVLEDTP